MKKIIGIIAMITLLIPACSSLTNIKKEVKNDLEDSAMTISSHMPAEDLPHEGTWLTWPHKYTYGMEYQNEVEDIWIKMTQALHTGEKVHIIAYDKNEQLRIEKLLLANSVNMNQVDFVIAKSDDVWVRDTGPMFVFDENNKLQIADFGFDGWGEKVNFKKDDQIPVAVGKQKNIPVIDISDFVLEGGSIEIDGNGTLMASLSSVVSKNRNQKMTVKQAEEYLSSYLGVTNFIWLEGVTDEDITDAHIDGMARFIDDQTILTVSESDFAELYESINMDDYSTMRNAKNVNGKSYKILELPLTKKNAKGLNYKGSYLNYYIGNKVVLVPIYEDENDAAALKIITELYPERKIVPIVVNNLFQYGGMIHCVTQQQPMSK